MTVYRQIVYTGRVQGVGFRYTVKQLAAGYEVVGWVRNLPDGSVELQAGGQADEVTTFFRAIAESHLGRHIKETAAADAPTPANAWSGFAIRP